jgi:glutamine cyclotransferase
VDWINIADARRLTELGLAERNREGWNITADGIALLATHDPQGRSTLSE